MSAGFDLLIFLFDGACFFKVSKLYLGNFGILSVNFSQQQVK